MHVPRAVFVDLEPSVIDEVSFIFIIKGFIPERCKIKQIAISSV